MELLGILVVHAVLAVVLHEAGHALGAVLVGARVRGFRFTRDAMTLMDAPRAGWTRGSLSVVMGAGIAMNLVTAVVLMGTIPVAAVHALCAIANAIPTTGSDGRALWMLFRNRGDDVVKGYSKS